METYSSILQKMQNKFKDLAGYDVDEASDVGIRIRVLAAEIYSAYTNIEWLKNQMFAQTATGERLDLHAQQRGLKREGNTSSHGTLTFSRTSARGYSVEIPAGTICSTAGIDPVKVITLESGTISDSGTSVTVSAKSVDKGSVANLSANSVTVFVTAIAGVDSVTNGDAFIGACDAEDDEVLRKRLMESYENLSTGSNCEFYKQIALKHDGIKSASAFPMNRGEGTVDIFVASIGSVPNSDIIAEVQADVDNLKGVNVDAKVLPAVTTTVNIAANISIHSNYSSSDVIENCKTAIRNYFNSLNVGDDVLSVAIGNAIFNVDGVVNYNFPNSSGYDTSIDGASIAVLGTLIINEV